MSCGFKFEALLRGNLVDGDGDRESGN